jgi:superfamily II DNA/RNA helicase
MSKALTPLHDSLRLGLEKTGIQSLNAVQVKSFVPISLHKDVVIHARCGSGKSLAYILPLLNRRLFLAEERGKGVSPIVILQPTSVLSRQTASVVSDLSVNLNLQVLSEEQPRVQWGDADVVVSTPARYLADIPRRSTVHPSTLVLDEADQLLTGSSAREIQEIISHFPGQTVLAAATITSVLAARIHRRWSTAFWARDEEWHAFYSGVSAEFVKSPPGRGKLLQLAGEVLPLVAGRGKVLVFCDTPRRAKEVEMFLKEKGWPVQEEIVCVTDKMGRGVDWREVKAIVNFHTPGDVQTFLHRAGRLDAVRGRMTGGSVVTMMENEAEERRMNLLQEKLGGQVHGVFSARRSLRNSIS